MKFFKTLAIYLIALNIFTNIAFATSGENANHTIETLAKLTDQELFKLVEEKGINIDCVPNGRSAGKPGFIDKNVIMTSNGTKAFFRSLFSILGPVGTRVAADIIWKGKTFKRSNADCTSGTGVNRVGFLNLFTLENQLLTRSEFINDDGRFSDTSEQGFINALEANENDVNIVELNYHDPKRDPFGAGKKFGIRDIMIPIQGKNGVIFIGRAYTGEWESSSEFRSEGMLAWFFLDFSPAAVRNSSLLGSYRK